MHKISLLLITNTYWYFSFIQAVKSQNIHDATDAYVTRYTNWEAKGSKCIWKWLVENPFYLLTDELSNTRIQPTHITSNLLIQSLSHTTEYICIFPHSRRLFRCIFPHLQWVIPVMSTSIFSIFTRLILPTVSSIIKAYLHSKR